MIRSEESGSSRSGSLKRRGGEDRLTIIGACVGARVSEWKRGDARDGQRVQ